jgi:hypothetical protein
MPSYTIETSLFCSASGRVTFPEGKAWADVSEWFVKWDVLHVKFKGGEEWSEFALHSDTSDAIDWKHPINVHVYPEAEDGEVDYCHPIEGG